MSLLPSKKDEIIGRTDSFIKIVLKNYRLDIMRKRKIENEHKIYFADVDKDLYRAKMDAGDYEIIRLWIKLDHFLVAIENELLYEAMQMLTKKRLKIILYSYFEDLTDKEIGKIMMIPKSTVHRQRIAALHNMRENIEKGLIANDSKMSKENYE